MNGKEAYYKIRRIPPDIKVIFASGYASETILQKGLLDHGMPLISKPLSLRQLVQMTRSVLDETSNK